MEKIKIAVTGLSGFIGWHFLQFNHLQSNSFEIVSIDRTSLERPDLLNPLLQECKGIVHIAGVNRVKEGGDILLENVAMAKKIREAVLTIENKPFIFYTSSIQEWENNEYGRGKKEARLILEDLALITGSPCLSWMVPNVFGPFCKPFYNSVVSTFCHQIWNNQELEIKIDKVIPLVFVQHLVKKMWVDIREALFNSVKDGYVEQLPIKVDKEIMVSDLLNLLREFKIQYSENGNLPDLSIPFNRDLFNTFLTYSDCNQFFPFRLKKHTDARGSFVELARLGSGGQVSFSTTEPGITRGNHFHTRKAERFAVIKGTARIDFRKLDEDRVYSFYLNGEEPSFVDMPIWYTHNITNVGNDMLYTVFWINEPYDAADGDTFALNV